MDDVDAVGRQQAHVDSDLVGSADGLEVGAHAGLIGDDPRVLRIGLSVAAVGRGGVVHDPAGNVEQLLVVSGEQRDQQGGTAGVQVGRPADVAVVGGKLDHRADELEEGSLVVLDSLGQQHPSFLVEHDAVVRFLPGVDSGPHSRHVHGPPGRGSTALSMTTPARPYPTIGVAILNQRSSHRRAAGGHSQ